MNHRDTETKRGNPKSEIRNPKHVSDFGFLLLFLLCAPAPLWLVLADESKSHLFILETADHDPVTAPLLSLGEDWSVRLGGREEVRAAGPEVLALRRAGAAMPSMPVRNLVLFANGDALPISRVRLVDERFVLTPRVGATKEFRVSPSQVALVWLTSPDGERHPDKMRRTLAAGQRTRDRILLRNGDSLEGTLTGMDEKTVRLEVDKRQRELQLDKIAVIAMNTELTSRRQPKGPYARLVLANGSRLTLASATSDGQTLSGKLASGAPVQVKVQDLVALSLFQGRADYLSDLKPSKIEQTPFLDAAAPPVIDGSAKGRDLRVAGGVYDKGLGMHSACRMTYELAGGYKRFEAVVGLDDATGRNGSARVGLLVDGKPQKLGLEGDLTHRNGPLSVRIELNGAKHLTLVVDFGDRGDVQADVNWIDARLINK
jgi:hypothetical protein